MEKLSYSPTFLENFEMNVVYFSKACALNSLSLDNLYYHFCASNFRFLCMQKPKSVSLWEAYTSVWRWGHFVVRLVKNGVRWSKNSKICIVGIQTRKYVHKWICVNLINVKTRNVKIQANYTAKVKDVRESPLWQVRSTAEHSYYT